LTAASVSVEDTTGRSDWIRTTKRSEVETHKVSAQTVGEAASFEPAIGLSKFGISIATITCQVHGNHGTKRHTQAVSAGAH